MKLRRLVSCMMALLLVCSLPLTAFADTWYLDKGSITVNATESGQTVSQENGVQNHLETTPTVITQTAGTTTENTVTIEVAAGAEANVTIEDVNIVNSDPTDAPPVDHSGEAAVTIDVADGAEANVTLDGVSIDASGTGRDTALGPISGKAAVQIVGNGDVTLELDGENTVQGGFNRAGVEKNTIAPTDIDPGSGNGQLTITDENETQGSLEATGGDLGAGIGGGYESTGSNITITGNAEVTAQGGHAGSGIGGGLRGSGSDITISGSTEVTAKGDDGGAGIGGGEEGNGINITIEASAEVTAQGGLMASGIGGGAVGTGSKITISEDAQVKAQGGESLVNKISDSAVGAGAAIGNGGAYQRNTTDPEPLKGQEVTPNTNGLNEGWVATYAPGTTDLDTATPSSLTYRDDSGTVTTEKDSQKIEIEEAVSATADTHGHNAGFRVGNELVAVTTHNYGAYTADGNATCTRDDTESAKCTVPGCTAKLERTLPNSKLQHEYGDYVPDTNNLATCTKAGTKTAKCKNCPATDTVPDPIKDHSMGAYHTEIPATCQKEGVERRDCANCTYSETRPLKKVDHSYGDFSSDNNATCTADGTKTRKCIWCGLEDTVPDPGTMLKHELGKYYTDTPATCKAEGVERRDCANCDYSETRPIDKLKHNFTNYISDKNATYEADGTKTAKCDHCDATHTIPDPGSKLVREAPLYRVVGQDGKTISCQAEQSSGVLTITVDADFATLTGSLSGLKTLRAQGVDTIVFVTNGATSTFALADLLAQGGDGYTLTHDGKTVTFTLSNGTDISKILK